MVLSFKHFNGATIEVDDYGKKRIFYDNIEFKSISEVSSYINNREQTIKRKNEESQNKYYSENFLKGKYE